MSAVRDYITRSGEVMVDGLLLGWVDKYDHRRPYFNGTTWRGVKDGGRLSPVRYRTRAEAAAWVKED